MRKSLRLTVLFLLSWIAVNGQTATFSAAPGGMPAYRWLTDSAIVVGRVIVNNPVTVSFEFVNSGKAPLVISRVEPSCGCTAVDYSKDPVGPGQKGYIKTTYNAATVGVFTKTVTVFSNTADIRKVLSLKGEVVTN